MSTLLASGHVLIGAQVAPALAGLAKVQAGMAATAAGSSKMATALKVGKASTLAIGAAFGLSIKAAADFESQLNSMQAVSGATDKQMRAVSKTAKQLGNDAKLPATSAKDAAAAMTELAKGGLTADQAMKAARGTLMLSAAAGVENARAAEIQADALNAFGLKASQAGRVADILAASANVSTAEIDDMARSLQQSATVANQAGYSIEETATALTFLANAGIKGSDAGTSLKTMLMRLQAPMGTGAKAIQSLGLSLRDSSGELKPMPALAEEFRSKLAGMTKAQRDQAMAAIFGSDAIRAANILLGKSAGQYAKQTAAVGKSGAAQDLAAAKMRGFNGALERFKSAMETAAISIGTILLPVATKIVNALSGMASKFESLSPGMQKFVVGLLAVVAAAAPVAIVAAKLVSAITMVAGAVRVLGAALLFASANPIVLIIAALVALGIALVVAYRKSETFRNVVQAVFSAVKSAVTAFVNFFRTTLPNAFNAVLSWLRGNWPKIVTIISGPFAPLVALATNAFGIRSALIGAFNAVVGAIRSAMSNAVGAVTSGMARAVAAVRGAVGAVTGAARAVGRGIWNGIRSGAAAISQLFGFLWSRISSAISSAAGAAFGAATQIGSQIISGVMSSLGGLAGAIRNKVQSAISSALSNLNPFSPVEHGGKLYIGDPIINGAVKAVEQGKKRLKLAITNTVRAAIDSARQNALSLSQSLAGTIGQGLDALMGRRLDALGNSPAAQRMRQIEAQQKASNSARERARLDAAVNSAETPQERAEAIADLNDWILDQERQALADQLAAEEQKLRDETDARKTAAERNLANLTDALNRGLISQQTFNERLQKILAESGMDYAMIGDLLGSSFANGFRDQLAALMEQIRTLGQWGGVPFVGDIKVEDPFQTQLREWTNRRKTLVNNLENARKAAMKSSSPGGSKITADEAKTIAARQQAITDWDRLKPKRAALGGIIRGGSVVDSVPLLAKPGEGVLSHRGMDALVDMASGRGGGGPVNITLNVVDRTFAGMSREQRRRVAEELRPELRRSIALTA